MLEAAAIAERRSEHPLATAIVRAADAGRLPPVEPETFEYTPGRGIVARTNGEDILVGNRTFVAGHGLSPDLFSTRRAGRDVRGVGRPRRQTARCDPDC